MEIPKSRRVNIFHKDRAEQLSYGRELKKSKKNDKRVCYVCGDDKGLLKPEIKTIHVTLWGQEVMIRRPIILCLYCKEKYFNKKRCKNARKEES